MEERGRAADHTPVDNWMSSNAGAIVGSAETPPSTWEEESGERSTRCCSPNPVAPVAATCALAFVGERTSRFPQLPAPFDERGQLSDGGQGAWYGRGYSGMDFRLLGPLEVVERDRPLALGGVKQRSLLAILLLQANELVSTDRLIDQLWGRPAGHLCQEHPGLRLPAAQQLGDQRLATQAPGYVLQVEPSGSTWPAYSHG